MSSGIARRRADKAARRKKLLAERHKLARAETARPLAERVRRLASAPLYSCLMQEGLFERGNGMLILSRRAGPGSLTMAAFLVDVWCLGVKDVIFRQIGVSEMEDFIATVEEMAPVVPVDPSYARKLLRDVVAWARALGFAPHADYAAAELLFGDSAAEASDAVFSFGHEGKPLYVPGPGDTPAQIRQRLEHLRRRLGEDGFDFAAVMPLRDDDEFTDEDFIDIDEDAAVPEGPGYDPAAAPDPAEWLALDESERMDRVEEYHRRAGISPPNEKLHAVFHVIVENQIARGDETPVRRTVERLIGEGLDRHEAVHAVATALLDHVRDVMQADKAQLEAIAPHLNETYFAAVERLTAEGWRREYGAEDEAEDS
jgi:hypothetical protein